MKNAPMIEVTEDEAWEGSNGACLSCREITYGGIEPDATRRECENCGENMVFGLEYIAEIGKLIFSE